MQDDILKLAYGVSSITEQKNHLIDSVLCQVKFLAINAHIEAARAGAAGIVFGLRADEMGKVAGTITDISAELRTAIRDSARRLQTVGADLLTSHKGARYTDLALNVIEIIDRNLYERYQQQSPYRLCPYPRVRDLSWPWLVRRDRGKIR